MSQIIIYRFRKDGTAVKHAWFMNAWKGSVAIWQALEQKYLPPYVPEFAMRKWWYRPGMTTQELAEKLHFAPSRTGVGTGSAIQEIWDLADNPQVSEDDRIVLLTTLDNMLLRKENIPRAAAAFRNFEGETSLPRQAEILEQLAAMEDCIAVGWCQNSVVSEDWSSCGGYDGRTQRVLPYNCITMNNHEWIMDALNSKTPT